MMTKEEIRGIRADLNLTQAQFGQLLGVHEITVSRWERGEFQPTPYQEVIMREFGKVARDKEVKAAIVGILIGAGVIAALYYLFDKARKKKKR